jgi:hypothetical protein
MRPGRQIAAFALLCLAARFALPCGEGDIVTAPDGEYKPVEKAALPDLSWLPRALKKEPAWKSAKVLYAIIVLGEGRKSVLTLAWDESGGTGSGCDTLYADRNFDGDLTGETEKAVWTCTAQNAKFQLGTVKSADGDGEFTITFASDDGNRLSCKVDAVTPKGKYSIAVVPHYTGGFARGADLRTAPVYCCNNDLLPVVEWPNPKTGKLEPVLAGAHLGTYYPCTPIDLGFRTGFVGSDINKRFDIFWASFPAPRGNSSPVTSLRVRDKDNRLIEELLFTGGGT